jgi:hypothetical protein
MRLKNILILSWALIKVHFPAVPLFVYKILGNKGTKICICPIKEKCNVNIILGVGKMVSKLN